MEIIFYHPTFDTQYWIRELEKQLPGARVRASAPCLAASLPVDARPGHSPPAGYRPLSIRVLARGQRRLLSGATMEIIFYHPTFDTQYWIRELEKQLPGAGSNPPPPQGRTRPSAPCLAASLPVDARPGHSPPAGYIRSLVSCAIIRICCPCRSRCFVSKIPVWDGRCRSPALQHLYRWMPDQGIVRRLVIARFPFAYSRAG
jgi:hypothetical protein